ncbi:hypothetical protein TRFO_22964 [Tritrichomonas foetus]|uniref:Protein kinase domain-containing protein n=1 Tax=Tritrichomonas foetus TaxID=1144522 RepID=A0A1J4KAT8_9EUKA|nr:hypothetical protein TRFO_22964 [Tritrichomonas foetus]|eukprot:OHT08529.1 hypothetical protein TRFO_22964 [Tritrichomonas foetus]
MNHVHEPSQEEEFTINNLDHMMQNIPKDEPFKIYFFLNFHSTIIFASNLEFIINHLKNRLVFGNVAIFHFVQFQNNENLFFFCTENLLLLIQTTDSNFFVDFLCEDFYAYDENDLIIANKYLHSSCKVISKNVKKHVSFLSSLYFNKFNQSFYKNKTKENSNFPGKHIVIEKIGDFIRYFQDVIIIFFLQTKINQIQIHNQFSPNEFSNSDLTEFESNDFIKLGCIGSGGYSSVYLSLIKSTGNIIAIKEFYSRKHFMREKNILLKTNSLNCLHIIRCYGFYLEDKIGKKKVYSLILDYFDCGNLRDFIRNHSLSNTKKTKIILAVLNGIDKIHSMGIMHRDIKLDNIMINKDFYVCLCDFDGAKLYSNQKKNTVDVGTLQYMAPEQILNENVSFQTDLYSLGLLIYELATNHLPFENFSLMEMISKIENGDIPNLSPQYGPIDAIYRMLTSSKIEARTGSLYILDYMIKDRRYFRDSNVDEVNMYIKKFIIHSFFDHDRKDIQFIIDRANYGDCVSQFYLGLMYFNGIIKDNHINNSVKIDDPYKKSFEWFEKASKSEMPAAIHNLAYAFENGFGIECNLTQAIALYHKAADIFNFPSSQYSLAVCYENGKGVEKDWDKAIDYYIKAVKNDHVEAMWNLAICYEQGEGVDKDLTHAVELYIQAADHGYGKAQFNLGFYHQNGYGVPCDLEKAKYYYTLAAENGISEAEYYLATIYEKNNNTLEKSYDLYKSAADNGFSNAQYKYGCILQNVKKKNNEAALYFLKSSLQGNIEASLKLGFLYLYGEGVEIDYQKSFDLFSRSIEAGIIDALPYIALIHEHNQNYIQANECYEQLNQNLHDEKGNFTFHSARVLLKSIKYQNDGILKLNEAAHKGNGSAELMLGKIYLYGLYNCIKDEEKGLSFLKKASAHRITEAKFLLACYIEKYNSINNETLNLYLEAAKDGNLEAIKRLKKYNPTKYSNCGPKSCSYSLFGDNFEIQHLYICITCNMAFGKCICNFCAHNCHSGHEIIDTGEKTMMFCDCKCKN